MLVDKNDIYQPLWTYYLELEGPQVKFKSHEISKQEDRIEEGSFETLAGEEKFRFKVVEGSAGRVESRAIVIRKHPLNIVVYHLKKPIIPKFSMEILEEHILSDFPDVLIEKAIGKHPLQFKTQLLLLLLLIKA